MNIFDNRPTSTYDYKVLVSEADWIRAYPVMNELRNGVSQEEYLSLRKEMVAQGYRMISLEEKGQIVSLAGIVKLTNFYYGCHLWVYDLVTTSSLRSSGHGLALLDHIETIAREEDCKVIALSSGLAREDAHRFYLEKAGFERVSYVFRKSLY